MDFLSGDHPPGNGNNSNNNTNLSGNPSATPSGPNNHDDDDDLHDLLSPNHPGLYTPYEPPSDQDSADNDAATNTDEEEDEFPPLSSASAAASGMMGLDDSGRKGKYHEREMQLAQRTNQIVSDYQNFLSELGNIGSDGGSGDAGDGAVGAVGGSGGYKDYHDEEFGTDTALQIPTDSSGGGDVGAGKSGMVHRSWRNNDVGGYRDDLTPIPEDSSRHDTAGTGDGTWPDYPGLHEYYDYDKDRYRNSSKSYRYNFCGYLFLDRKNRKPVIGCIIGICLMAIILSSTSHSKNEIVVPTDTSSSSSGNSNSNNPNKPPVTVTNPNDPDSATYEDVLKSPYQPIWYDRSTHWQGHAYIQSLSFCASQNSRVPCPYQIYCPIGAAHSPLGGPKLEDNGTWAPVGNRANEWVQVGSSNPDDNCRLYSDVHDDDGPLWGLTGENSEEVTRHVMCCIDPSQFPDPAVEMIPSDVMDRPPALEDALEEDHKIHTDGSIEPNKPLAKPTDQEKVKEFYHPVWFDSETYTGTSYKEALDFCALEAGGRMICPYSAYCPDGYGEPPLDGVRDTNNGNVWAPLLKEDMKFQEQWVGVGPKNMCQKLEVGRRPKEVVNGMVETMGVVLCCGTENMVKDAPASTGGGGDSAESGNSDQDTKGSNTASNNVPKPIASPVNQIEVKKYYQPKWYGPGTYTGTTYQEAMGFCSSRPGLFMICPYEAYCPDGYGAPPLDGVRGTQDVKIWAPMVDERLTFKETWVGVGPENLCEKLQVGRRPPEVLAGEETATGYVLCCSMIDWFGDLEEGHQFSGLVVDGGGGGGGGEDSSSNAAVEVGNDIDSGSDSKTEEASTSAVDNSNVQAESPKTVVAPANQLDVKEFYSPQWFGPDTYAGVTFQDGIDFCSAQPGEFTVCPYAAYCPDGPGEPPLDGVKGNEDVKVWAPMASADLKFMETWVGIGPENFCDKSQEGQRPREIIDGDAASMGYIMCCSITNWFDTLSNESGVTGGESSNAAVSEEGNDGGKKVTGITISLHDDGDNGNTDTDTGDEAPAVTAPADQLEVKKYYEPEWFESPAFTGSTFEDGLTFCSGKPGEYMICPYDAYCPDGPGKPPLDGVKGKEDVKVWAPVADADLTFMETWVGVGPENTCELLVKGRRPQEVQNGNEDSVGHVMCCNVANWFGDLEIDVGDNGSEVDHGGVNQQGREGTAVDTSVIEADDSPDISEGGAADQFQVGALFHPKWFGPDSSWQGTTYEDGVDFCAGEGMVVCPYGAYCPDGPHNPPYMGIQGGENEMLWAPMELSDGAVTNSWVSVGPINPCEKVDDFEEHNTSFLKYIMCCNEESQSEENDSSAGDESSASEPQDSTEDSDSNGADESVVDELQDSLEGNTSSGTDESNINEPQSSASNEALSTAEQEVIRESMNPQWFTRDTGWKGSTYNQAQDFCKSAVTSGLLCPRVAACPNGKESPPYSIGMPVMNGVQWIPIVSPPNSWILAGKGDEYGDNDLCHLYMEIHDEQALFGLTGEMPEVKDNILCCSIGKSTRP